MTSIGKIFSSNIESGAVRNTRELKRILELPQRDALELGEIIAECLTHAIKTPNGTMTLRPLQATALAESHDLNGSLIFLPVGEGKTLISYLLPTVMAKEKPLLLVPGKLLDKTRKEFSELSKHWTKPENLEIRSYEKLSTTPTLLNDLNPDLIIADECFKLKSKKAGCTKRIHRYWHKKEELAFVAMSGTMTKRSYMDWWHLQLWALPDPLLVLPIGYKECEMWSEAFDEKLKIRRPIGALNAFGDNLDEARKGYGRHLRQVPGIISAEGNNVASSLYIDEVRLDSSIIQDTIKQMEKTWTLPDGTEFCEAIELHRHSCELSQGFYYRWVEQPPEEWAIARSQCNIFVREILRHSRTYETPAQIFDAYQNEHMVDRWLRIRGTFKPKTEPVWMDHSFIYNSVNRLEGDDCLIWTEFRAVGREIEKQFKIPYFHSHGKTSSGLSIYDHTGPAVVSVAAVGEGFNLQKWNSNYVLSSPASGTTWEQMLGRTHRQGQEADTVNVEVLISADVQRRNFKQAKQDAEYIQAITGQRQKLCYADYLGD